MSVKKFCLIIILLLPGIAAPAGAADYFQVAGLIDTRTTHSDGSLSVAGLADLARARGFEVLFLNDHDRLA
jgi:hypothetical protein